MQTISLDGLWSVKQADSHEIYAAQVPGCIHLDLLSAEAIPDHNWRDNEEKNLWVAEKDWTWSRTFDVDKSLLNCDDLYLCCEGLDTIATVEVNGQAVIDADNMFRTWKGSLNGILKAGENAIVVACKSPIAYMKKRHAEFPLPSWNVYHPDYAGKSYVRKMPCSFGWDWGPRGATQGIWKSISIKGVQQAEFDDVHVRQQHDGSDVAVRINSKVRTVSTDTYAIRANLSLHGEIVASAEGTDDLSIDVPNPQLWWPNGLGEQPLYDLKVDLLDDSGAILDERSYRLGLRDLKLIRQKDKWGESFLFEVNGVRFFSKGANWIPADIFLPRITRQDYERLIGDAADANMNMLRLWGGGFYEFDEFYEVCNEKGILIWHDFMFACAAYPTFDEAFLANCKEEFIDNLQRIRHHASIAFWCGNNELEQGLVADEWNDHAMAYEDYIKLFEQLMPDVIAEYDPDRVYWPSSGHTPGANGRDANNESSGDCHLWSVWFGNKPFEHQRTWTCRFMSEFGFQSFPEIRTIESFTEPADRNWTSYIMDFHQRSQMGNRTIFSYMLDWFQMPKSFEENIRVSQLSHGLCIKYATEHLRRIQPRNMGVLYWQINDMWPVASWSSIDSFGRWKAPHFLARQFFAPVLVSLLEDADRGTIAVHLSNHRRDAFTGDVKWRITDAAGVILQSGSTRADVGSQTNAELTVLDCTDLLKSHTARDLLIWAEAVDQGTVVSRNLGHFEKPKHIQLQKPNLQTSVEEGPDGSFRIVLSSDKPALWNRLELTGGDARFSDNFICLDQHEQAVIAVKPHDSLTAEQVRYQLKVTSLFDTYTF